MNKLITVSSLVVLLSLAAAVPAQDLSNSVVTEAGRAAFSELERQLIGEYYTEDADANDTGKAGKEEKGARAMPPGLAKRDRLPPGLAAQLQRNGTLPPGLAKRELPPELERQLPPVREGYTRSVLEDLSVVLIEEATGRIADIIRDNNR